MLLAKFTTFSPESEEYSIEVKAQQLGENSVGIEYSISRNNEPVVSPIVNFDLRSGSIHMTGLEIGIPAYVACLVTCGLGNIVQEILECWTQGHRNPRDMLTCLKAKRISITPMLINCSIGCLSGLTIGSQ